MTPLKEEDAYPAEPEPGYGWEKLYAEELCKYYRQDYGFETRMVRFHNVYGPLGTYDGGKEKSPAALCRKVALAADGDEVEIWGDGQQTRSYMYVDDCVEGLIRLMASDCPDALNLGTDRMVTIDELFFMIGKIAGKKLRTRHDLSKPQGVRGRNSDNTRLPQSLGLGAFHAAGRRFAHHLPLDRKRSAPRRARRPFCKPATRWTLKTSSNKIPGIADASIPKSAGGASWRRAHGSGFTRLYGCLVASLGLTVPVRQLALRVGMVDRPGPRKVHLQPIPLLGGLAIYSGVLLAMAVSLVGGEALTQILGILAGRLWSYWSARSTTAGCFTIR